MCASLVEEEEPCGRCATEVVASSNMCVWLSIANRNTGHKQLPCLPGYERKRKEEIYCRYVPSEHGQKLIDLVRG
jgi:hypothetical protein